MSTIEKRKQMSKRRQQVGGLAVLALGLGALAWVPNAVAGPSGTVLAEPVARDGYGIEISAEEVVVGETVTVTITADEVSDLYAYDLSLTFDPAVLDYVDGSADTDLTGETYGLEGDGTVEIVHTKLGTSPAAAGAVTLATATFDAVGVGSAAVSAVALETVTTERVSSTVPEVGAVPVTALAKAAPVATVAPKVTGTAKVGKTLTVTPGTWDVDGVALTYQWLRAGKPVAGATGTSYDVLPADAGDKLDVVVSAAKANHVTGTAIATAGKVAKATTTTKVTVPGKVKAGKKATAKIVVGSADLDPTGTVKVTYGGKVVKTVKLKNGKATVALPGKKKGSYALVVAYGATDAFTGSSKKVTVRVR
jgi:hypothetical protein